MIPDDPIADEIAGTKPDDATAEDKRGTLPEDLQERLIDDVAAEVGFPEPDGGPLEAAEALEDGDAEVVGSGLTQTAPGISPVPAGIGIIVSARFTRR